MRDDSWELIRLARKIRSDLATVTDALQRHIEATAEYIHSHKHTSKEDDPLKINAAPIEVHFPVEKEQRDQTASDKTHFLQKLMFGVNLVTLVVLGAYAVFTFGQWGALTEGIEQTQMSLGILRRSMAIAERQTKLIDETSKRQFRAYVLYESGTIDISKDGRSYTVSLKAKNSGLTPAYNVTWWMDSKVSDPINDLYHTYQDDRIFPFGDTACESTDLGNGVPLPITNKFTTGTPIAPTEVIYVWGIIDYRDQFQRIQYDLFRLQGKRTASGKWELVPIVNGASDPEAQYTKPNNCDPTGKSKALPILPVTPQPSSPSK